ncbi:MAG: hypothetical protein JWM86_1731 [Thermoleophilia bacterium]|nr:hypothetical protein [Thermoleophilia bacterium]
MEQDVFEQLDRLTGHWVNESTHPAFPGLIIRGATRCAWLDGGRFLEQRSEYDHPDFPNALSVIGIMGMDRADLAIEADATQLRMHYLESRGVCRIYDMAIDSTSWRYWRLDPSFPQRATGTFSDDGTTIDVVTQLRRDGADWVDDLKMVCRRA